MTQAAGDALDFNPFPGLRPFQEEEEYLFFGREAQVDAMVNKLAATRFLAVVGSSGSGKSSLVNCGLRPGLRRGLMASAGSAWRMAQFRPGGEPLRALARALAAHGVLFGDHDESGLPLVDIVEATLRMSSVGLVDIYEQARLSADTNLLVVVDQFEELFRYRPLAGAASKDAFSPGEEATALVNLLLQAATQRAHSIYVVITMRSDFLGDCAQFSGLAEAINVGQYLVPRMSRDERRCAIGGPARVGGSEISPVLLTRLVNDVGDNPDQLSILQHALNRTWACWQRETNCSGPLELSHYESIGTMAHALDRHAERAYQELGDARLHAVCERVFKALTDTASDPRGVRRPTTFQTLCAVTEATGQEVTRVIAVFRKPSRSFLMPPAGEPLNANTVIDISHESLMRVWQRLVRWAGEEAQSAHTYRRLADTAKLHKQGEAGLWRQPDLGIALKWRATQKPNAAWAERYQPGFSEAMRFLEDSEAEERAQLVERARKASIRMTFFVGSVLAALTGLLVGLLYAQYNAETELRKQVRELQDKIRTEQATAADVVREQRTMMALQAADTVPPRDRKRFFSDVKDRLRSLATNKTHRDIVSKLEASRPLSPDESAVLELYAALDQDDLLRARQLHLDLTRDSSRVPGAAKAAWRDWAAGKKARNRELKLIGTLYDMQQKNAGRGEMDELLHPWSLSVSPPQLDESLFVVPLHFTLASQLAEGRELDAQGRLVCQLYSAAQHLAFEQAEQVLQQLATADPRSPHGIAAQAGKSLAREGRDRMLILELSSAGRPGAQEATASQAAAHTAESGAAPWKRLFPGAPPDGSGAPGFSVYFDGNSTLARHAFANPIHFEIACKLLAQHPQWKLGGRSVACNEKVAAEPLSQDEEHLIEVYKTMNGNQQESPVTKLELFQQSDSSGPGWSPHYLLAASAVGDLDPPAKPSPFVKIVRWLDELKWIILAALLWPLWELSLWMRGRLGRAPTYSLKASPMRRLLAGTTDICLGIVAGAVVGGAVGAVCWVVLGAVTGTYLHTAETVGALVTFAVGLVVCCAYLLFRDAIKFKYHRSIGKILFSLRPIRVEAEGAPVTLKVSAKRNALLVAGFVAPPLGSMAAEALQSELLGISLVVLFLLFLLVLCPVELILSAIRDGRTIHDRIGKTKVINVRSAQAQALDLEMQRSWMRRREAALAA